MNGFDLSTITGVYYGSTQYSAIYLGSTKIWPTGNVTPVHDYSLDYFTIESLANSNTITWTRSSSSASSRTISVSSDNGTTWTSYSSNTTGVTIGTLNNGDKLLIKGTNSKYGIQNNAGNILTGSANFKVYGNILSLIYGDNFTSQTSLNNSDNKNAFVRLFKNSTNLTDAENLILPSMEVPQYAYMSMFEGCTALTTAPQLPATTIYKYAYQEMFRGCTSLTSVPNLPVQSLTEHCYDAMFRECSALTTAPTISATTLGEYCCTDMFRDCAYLQTAPDLLATTLTKACYSQMFEGCVRLSSIKCLATDISATDCTTNWVRYVAASGTFIKSSSNTSWTTDNSGIPSGWTVQSV